MGGILQKSAKCGPCIDITRAKTKIGTITVLITIRCRYPQEPLVLCVI